MTKNEFLHFSEVKQGYKPDILTCLANLSNDEVFTPPNLVNDILDMLPKELFERADTKFLDPVCKSGVFLREIAKRLMKGLGDIIADEEERRKHVFTKQLFGIAITELTAQMSRRSLYCSKDASGKFSVVKFAGNSGNISFRTIQHTFKNGNCIHCGASENEYGEKVRKNLESHAYEFIHMTDKQIKEMQDMKFDVIIGNPPYQLSDGGFGDSAKPLYHKFVEQAKKLNPRYLSMIIPARWYSGGKGLDDFRASMLNDTRIQELHDFPETSECFAGINVRGGICYFLWNKEYNGECTVVNHKNGNTDTIKRPLLEKGAETFVRYNLAIGILNKIKAFNEPTMGNIVSSRKPFGLATNFMDFALGKSLNYPIILYRNGSTVYVSNDEIEKNDELVKKIKVLVSKASPGSDDYPHLVLSEPVIAIPPSACTETYLVVATTDNLKQANNLKKYMSTKFFRFLILLVKTTQDVPKKVYQFVPLLNFNEEWSDEILFNKYNITEDEQQFISTLVKPVKWALQDGGQ